MRYTATWCVPAGQCSWWHTGCIVVCMVCTVCLCLHGVHGLVCLCLQAATAALLAERQAAMDQAMSLTSAAGEEEENGSPSLDIDTARKVALLVRCAMRCHPGSIFSPSRSLLYLCCDTTRPLHLLLASPARPRPEVLQAARCPSRASDG